MSSIRKTITVDSSSSTQFAEITSGVQSIVSASGVEFGSCQLFVPHTTAAITLNENADAAVCRDLCYEFNRLSPQRASFEHLEGNSAAHVKASLVGNSLLIFIENGKLMLGQWQGIYLAEFDGPRRREVWCKVISD
ncbi:MAG: secondary thiamine-phosphate synthase enzyme YjbQ [Dehalogenimonas sp.]